MSAKLLLKLGFSFCGRHLAEIDARDLQVSLRRHMSEWMATLGRESRPQCLVSLCQRSQALCQSILTQRTGYSDGKRQIVVRVAGIELVEKPKSLLCE